MVGSYHVCVIDQLLAHSPADYVRRPPLPTDSPTLGLGHLQFEALLTPARGSANRNDFALIAMLGLLGPRIFEAYGANIADLGEEHGHRILKIRGKGGKTVLVPLPPAVARAIDQATEGRAQGPILRNRLNSFQATPLRYGRTTLFVVSNEVARNGQSDAFATAEFHNWIRRRALVVRD